MNITVINVGYGDAILFQSGNGFTVLLDGGGSLPEEFQGDPYRIPAVDYLKMQGIARLDAVIISHIHEDHVCGLEAVFEQIHVGKIFTPYPAEPFLQGHEMQTASAQRSVSLYTKALNAYRRILLRAAAQNIPVYPVKAGDRLKEFPEMAVQVLTPGQTVIDRYMALVQRAYCAQDDAEEILRQLDAMSNQTSLLLRIETENIVFLSAADSCPSQWKDVPSFLLQDANVLKLPHHGQIDSISEDLMRGMPLSYVITTASSDRRYQSANEAVYRQISAWHAKDKIPCFLFADERDYPPYFSHPEGFRAITLKINSDGITPEFIE